MQRYSVDVYTNNKGMKRPFTGYQVAVAVLLFMMSMNVVNRFYYIAFIAAVVCIIMQRESIRISGALLPTFLFSISLCIFSPTASDSILGFIKQFTFPLCTLVGYNLISANKVDYAEKQAISITVLLAGGACGHYFLNMLRGIGGVSGRNTIDFWTNMVMSATGQAALACLMIAVAVALIFAEGSKRTKVCAGIVLVGIVIYNLSLAGRTLFILLAVAFLVGFIARFVTLRNSMRRVKLVSVVLLVFIIVTLIWELNVFGIQNTIKESNFYNRFFAKNAGEEISEDGRLERKLEHIKRMDEHLWGGSNIRKEVGYSHDIIFDTYDEAGVFALFFVVIILFDMLRKCCFICRSSRISDMTKIILPCVMTILMLEFMIEPILQGMAWLLADYCVMYGAYSRVRELC